MRGNSALVAVASRDPERARQFIEDCQADVPLTPRPVACGSYQELLDRDDIDAVYLPLPTGIRKEWVLQAARAGKHVLCEKPCAVCSADRRGRAIPRRGPPRPAAGIVVPPKKSDPWQAESQRIERP